MVLIAFGLIMIASASSIKAHNDFVTATGAPDDYWYLIRQSIWVFAGIVAVIFFSNFDYRKLRYFAFPALLMVMGLLGAVFLPLIGKAEALGAKRWLDFGLMSLQPSEITKLVLAVYLATWLERKGSDVKDFKYGFLPFAFIVSIIILLLYFQEDLGTTIIICVMAVSVFYLSGAHLMQLFLGGLVGLMVVGLLIWVRPFRIARIEAWLYPDKDPKGISYHVTQARLTVASGGIFGLGYGHSRQKYEYLPHAPTDSIFAIICEELGLVGGGMVVFLYVAYLQRMMRIALLARDNFGKLLAASLGIWIGIQAFINIGGLLRIIPLTGVPLPFISYGGSSLLMCSIATGIALNISKNLREQKKNARPAYGRGNGRSSRTAARTH